VNSPIRILVLSGEGMLCRDPLMSSHEVEFVGAVLGWAPVAESRVRAPGVVAVNPGDDLLSCGGEVGEVVQPDALFLEGAEGGERLIPCSA
jgi:hypothetical protein